MFDSADSALKWAARIISTDIVKTSSINRMSGGNGNGDMSPHDRHAQAALIMKIVERHLDSVGKAYIRAQYLRELQDGHIEIKVLDSLVVAVIGSLPTGSHSRRGVSRLVLAYFGKGCGMVSVRTDLCCNNRRYYEYKKITNESLHQIELRAMEAARLALDCAGLLNSNECKNLLTSMGKICTRISSVGDVM